MKLVVRGTLAGVAVLVLGSFIVGAVLMGLGWKAFVVHTGSMTPNIRSGDLVIDRPAGPVHVGEVITFEKAPGQYTTHRVAAITTNGIETRGDANPSDDYGYVTPSEIAGRTTWTVPYAGFAVKFLSDPVGITGIVLLMCSVWLAGTLFLAAPAMNETGPLLQRDY